MVIEFSARLIQTVLKAFNVFFQGRCGHYITTTQIAEIRKTEQFRQALFLSNEAKKLSNLAFEVILHYFSIFSPMCNSALQYCLVIGIQVL